MPMKPTNKIAVAQTSSIFYILAGIKTVEMLVIIFNLVSMPIRILIITVQPIKIFSVDN